MELVGVREKLKTGMPTDGLMALVGEPKCGKTTLAASFPDSYILELEPGGADRVRGRIHDIEDLTGFREALKTVLTEPSVKTVVIDTIDALSTMLEDEVAKKFGLETIDEQKKGVSGFDVWGCYRAKIEGLVGYLKASRKLIVLVAHTREPKADKDGNYVTPKGINLPGKSGPFVASQADLIGYVYKQQVGTGTECHLTFRGGPSGTWGSRVEELNDRDLILPKHDPYSALAAVFAPTLPKDLPAKPVKKEKVAA